MSGFRLKLNRLKNIAYASTIQEHLPFEKSFEVEYFFEGSWNLVFVKPILVNTVAVFLVSFPEDGSEPLALVYNKKDTWADIEKESTGLTEAVGAAIENYYSECYLPWSGSFGEGNSNPYWDTHILN
ncbi:hypothetical protein [Puia sp.]|jgi:hypothetical protein|uniref:hypothetical protein n=1 Tax=Puia sp. TaxID=2045100 RepID=UPI002F3E354A